MKKQERGTLENKMPNKSLQTDNLRGVVCVQRSHCRTQTPPHKLRLSEALCKNNMEISKSNVEDSDQIGRLLVESWRHAYSGIMQQSVLDDLSVQKRSEGWKRILEKGPEVYVLRNGTEVLGLVQVCDFRGKLSRFCSFAEIPVLYLKPPAIGQGFGSMLLNFAQETTTVREAEGVALWVL